VATQEAALMDETEPENINVNKTKAYSYKGRNKSSKELVPKLWNTP
jgi:hypothetical protein